MRVGKELIGKPIYSVTDGKLLGVVKDFYLDLELGIMKGIYLGHEGIFSRKARLIPRRDISVLGIDSVLVIGSDVVIDSEELPEVEMWLRREDLQGRGIDTPGGTKVATVGDVLFDADAKIVGYSLARVFVEGPVAENRLVLSEAVLDTGSVDGTMTVDLSKAERVPAEQAEPPKPVEPIDASASPERSQPVETAEATGNEDNSDAEKSEEE